jgi:hypothetical protein
MSLIDEVQFLGYLKADELSDLLQTADMGIGTLAGHRVGLEVASSLKHRTYLGHGLPFITSVSDTALTDSLPFVMRVSPDDQAIDVRRVVEWLLSSTGRARADAINGWCEKNLTSQAIASQILARLSQVG